MSDIDLDAIRLRALWSSDKMAVTDIDRDALLAEVDRLTASRDGWASRMMELASITQERDAFAAEVDRLNGIIAEAAEWTRFGLMLEGRAEARDRTAAIAAILARAKDQAHA